MKEYQCQICQQTFSGAYSYSVLLSHVKKIHNLHPRIYHEKYNLLKLCSDCKQEKHISEFNNKDTGCDPLCKVCKSKFNKNYRDSHKEKMKLLYITYRQKYKEEIRSKRKPVASQLWRHSNEYYRWTEDVYKRDNHTCRHCGKSECMIIAHHIKSAKDHPELRYILENGICLCKECHYKVHYPSKSNNLY